MTDTVPAAEVTDSFDFALVEQVAMAVHGAWRDGMLSQGREVTIERYNWSRLGREDKELDRAIAREVIRSIRSYDAARPAPAVSSEPWARGMRDALYGPDAEAVLQRLIKSNATDDTDLLPGPREMLAKGLKHGWQTAMSHAWIAFFDRFWPSPSRLPAPPAVPREGDDLIARMASVSCADATLLMAHEWIHAARALRAASPREDDYERALLAVEEEANAHVREGLYREVVLEAVKRVRDAARKAARGEG